MSIRKAFTAIISTFLILNSYGAEFALINQEITLTSANNGFYFFMSPTQGPVDWYSPDNYFNGQVYFRFEVISQPTSEVCYFSFDIWGDYNGSTYTESAAPISGALNGPGSVSTFSSSPSTWYPHPSTGPVNFHNRNSFWRWGICHWFSKSPNYLLAPVHWSDDPESWEAWSHNSTWLPITVRVIVVAVSQGSTFSGWPNYLSPTKQPTPTYGIDYSNVQTNKTVPATDEYSNYSDMSSAVNGNGQKLALTPGQDVYFRTKAGGGLEASNIQHLDVPTRPSVPSYTIDYINETTSENVSTNIEYSAYSNFQNLSNGTNSKVSLTPGQDLHFRIKATASSFASNSFFLNVPDRSSATSITLDFINEVTSPVPSTVEYSTNISMSPASVGNNSAVSVSPGTNLYFRTKATSSAFRSAVQTLDVPDRPSMPVITIDYTNETTSPVASSLEYSSDENLNPAQSGEGSGIKLVPGTDLYFRKKATSTQFRSNIMHLDVPSRPAAPVVTFNYLTEHTSVISDLQEYSLNSNMVPAFQGTNQSIQVVPGTKMYFRYGSGSSFFASGIEELSIPQRPDAPAFQIDFHGERTTVVVENVYEYSYEPDFSNAESGINEHVSIQPGSSLFFRQKATDNQFKSDVQELSAPPRPAQQSYNIDFINETTVEPVHGHDEYSFYENMTMAASGDDEPLTLQTDTNYYLRIKATDDSFAGETFPLTIPGRPVINSDAGDTVLGVFNISIDYDNGTEGFDESDFEAINCSFRVNDINNIQVEPLQTGMILIRLKANSFDAGNFASQSIHVYAQLPVSSEKLPFGGNLNVYPNPALNEIHIKTTSDYCPVKIQIFDTRGNVFYHQAVSSELSTIRIDNIPSGLYILKATDGKGNSVFQKLTKL